MLEPMKNVAHEKSTWYARIPLSMRAKLLIAFIGLALLPMLLLGALTHFQTDQMLRKNLAQELKVQVVTAAVAVENRLSGVQRDLLSLARFLQRRLDPQMSEQQWLAAEQEFLETIRTEQTYYQVRFIATNGMEILRVNSGPNGLSLVDKQHLQFKGDRYYVQEAMNLKPGEIYLSHLDFNVEQGEIEIPRRLVVRMATPVAAQAGKLLGLVVINVFGEELLDSIEHLATATGERALLLNQNFSFIEMQQHSDHFSYKSSDLQALQQLAPDLHTSSLAKQPVVIFGKDQLLAIAPVTAGAGRLWYLVKLYPEALLIEELANLHQTYVLTGLPLVLLAAILAILAARRFSKPIGRLSGFAEQIAAGQFPEPPILTTRDELGGLSQSLATMARAQRNAREKLLDWNQNLQSEVERKMAELQSSQEDAQQVRQAMQKLEKQLLQADRLAALGLLSATVAHEIGNPLAGLKLRLQMLQRRQFDDQKLQQDLAQLSELVTRLSEFLKHLTGYAAQRPKGMVREDLIRVLTDLDFILREEAQRRDINLELILPKEPVWVCSQDQHLHQIFMNLILNALQAVENKGHVEVRIAQVEDKVQIQVTDNGCGLPETGCKPLFEPLFTTKAEGTGLGLAIVRQLVEDLGGEIHLQNRTEGGAVAEVLLSLAKEPCLNES